MKPEIIITEDGSNSLYVSSLNESYHSGFGAINESLHVFIKSGFEKAIEIRKEINVLEIGFGTGLNALLTLKESIQQGIRISYDGIEPNPIKREIYSKLNYPYLTDMPDASVLFNRMHESPSDSKIEILKGFNLRKIKSGLEDVELKPDFYQLIYFDAFSPDVQPDLWELSVFKKLYRTMTNGGVLVTYSAKGQVRRNMQSAGFVVERLPGPKGKREILRALKTGKR